MSKYHVELLKDARELIVSGIPRYICIALLWSHTDQSRPEYKQASDDILSDIRFSLNYTSTYDEWLYANGHITSDEYLIGYTKTEYSKKLKRSRLGWIDAMIEYWKDKP